MENKKLGELIKEYRELNNLSLRDFAEKIDVSHNYVSVLEKNYNPTTKKPPVLTIDIIKNVASVIGIDLKKLLNEVLSDETVINIMDNNLDYKDVDYDVIDTTVDIPIVGGVKAGVLIGAEDNYYETYGVDESIVTDAQENFIIKIEGDSMSPLFLDKDYILCKTQSDVYSNGNLGIVALEDTKPVIKRIYKYSDKIILRSENPLYKDIVITGSELENFRIVGIPKYLVKREF